MVEKKVIDRILERTQGNKRQAAQLLGISYKALLYKLREFEEMGL
jgi:two-component system response regulator AtoC